jgi:PAT family beta-lactamase induction signal transducer AmpG
VKAQKRIFSSFSSFFQKKQIGLAHFYLTFRLGESQLLKMLTFLIDDIAVGGLGLTTQDVGVIYGTFE